MLATGVRLLAAVCVGLLACTSIEATTPEGLPSGAAKIICDFGRELMDAAKIAAEAAKAARTKARLARDNAAVVAAGKAAVDAIKAAAGMEKGESQEQHEGRNAEAHLDAEDEHAIRELDEAAEGAAKASSEATVSAQALKQYITVLGALAGRTTGAKTCLDATGDMTVSNGLDTYLKTKCAQMFTADSKPAVMPAWSEISADTEVAKADGRVGSVTEHSNLGEESNGNTQDKCILFARAASSNAGIAVAASRAYTFGQFIKVTFVNTNGKIEIAKHTGRTPGGMSLKQIAQNIKQAQDAVSQGQCTKRDICLAADVIRRRVLHNITQAQAKQRDAQHEGKAETPRAGANDAQPHNNGHKQASTGPMTTRPKDRTDTQAPTTQDESTEPRRASNTGPRRKGVAALGMALARKAMG
ncbi:hypothetical protein ERJ75_001373700 [Trypanosoma vivax]|uniref:Variant surface glycoprotein (VSG) n=1 Tax=Trypanosoma vivax (strain Y486) TaxID=1055687 RepID=F9WPZ0_TRYVY|nr:hypothetical protein ERJ75_001373700 [Trypanosoma vivax]CCD19617.1 hypothetical protein, conserved in T.vivax [Trypanosoma vivax Y486]|eukprot:CCD19617.1 hypothetical protein, conserved in T.vivax [Trypanosoma vivax Y486]